MARKPVTSEYQAADMRSQSEKSRSGPPEIAAGAEVPVDGKSRGTTVKSSTEIVFARAEEDIAAAGERMVTVVNPAPGSAGSGPLSLNVTQ